jgi:hypothetical protein
VVVESPGSTPVAPAFVTHVSGRLWEFWPGLVDGLEVAGECGAWFDGDDRAVVIQDVVEQAGEELAALGRVGLVGGEVASGLVEPRRSRRLSLPACGTDLQPVLGAGPPCPSC